MSFRQRQKHALSRVGPEFFFWGEFGVCSLVKGCTGGVDTVLSVPCFTVASRKGRSRLEWCQVECLIVDGVLVRQLAFGHRVGTDQSCPIM